MESITKIIPLRHGLLPFDYLVYLGRNAYPVTESYLEAIRKGDTMFPGLHDIESLEVSLREWIKTHPIRYVWLRFTRWVYNIR